MPAHNALRHVIISPPGINNPISVQKLEWLNAVHAPEYRHIASVKKHLAFLEFNSTTLLMRTKLSMAESHAA